MKILCILTIIFCAISLIWFAVCFGISETIVTDEDIKKRQETIFDEEITVTEEKYSKNVKIGWVIAKLLFWAGPIFGLALGIVGLIVL